MSIDSHSLPYRSAQEPQHEASNTAAPPLLLSLLHFKCVLSGAILVLQLFAT